MASHRLIGLVLCVAALAATAAAHASTPYDLRGTWHDANSLGYTSTFYIDTTNLSTGQFTGHSAGFTFVAVAHGVAYTETISQTGTSYRSYVKGTISNSGNKLSGTFHDTVGHVGTFISTRISGPPGATSESRPAPTVTAFSEVELGAAVTLSCPHTVNCARATIVFTPMSQPVPTAATAGITGGKPSLSILGHKRITVPAGKSFAVTVHLNSRGKALLAQTAGPLTFRVTVFANGRVIRTATSTVQA